MFTLADLPKPPSANRYWRTNYQTRRKYVSAEGLAYRDVVRAAVLTHPERLALPIEGRLRVDVCFTCADRIKRDSDNLFKQLFDALQIAGVYPDDEAIDEIHYRRRFRHKDGSNRVTVCISVLPPELGGVDYK